MRKKITQREANRFRRRVGELEREMEALISRYEGAYPGVHIGSVTLLDVNHLPEKIGVARRLGHPVCCAVEGQTIRFYALREVQR